MKASVSPTFPKQKPSRSANESQRMELERLRKLTIEQRVIEALTLTDVLSGIKPVQREL